MATAFGAATNVTRREYRMRRLVSIVEKRTVVRARDLYRSGIHPEALSRALRRGLFLKIGRGLYARNEIRLSRVLLLLAISVFINYLDLSNLSIAAPLLKNDFQLSATHARVLLSSFFFTNS